VRDAITVAATVPPAAVAATYRASVRHKGPEPVRMRYLLLLLGPILCLEIASKSRASGVLLWAVVLQVSAVVIGANTAIDKVNFNHGYFKWSGLLVAASVPLFVVFLHRLARTLERPDLEQRARSILKLLPACVCGIAFILAGFYNPAVPALSDYVRWVWPLLYFVGTLGLLVGVPVLFLRSFALIRALQGEITSRL
jgi:hypothetical protein